MSVSDLSRAVGINGSHASEQPLADAMFAVGTWAWLGNTAAGDPGGEGGAVCRVMDHVSLWNTKAYDVWIPSQERVLRVSAARIQSLDATTGTSVHAVQAAAAAARIADALARDVLVSPLEGTVEPLPHQIAALARAVASDRVRWLLADEVGLGKTIEAGLIFKELKARGLVSRVLVVAPSGLVRQWSEEMRRHFHESFRIMSPSDFPAVRDGLGLGGGDNVWRLHDQVICSLDAVKPIEARRGWSRDQLARYNRERFEDLITAGWDLIIIDEAHRLGGSTAQVARFKLGEALAHASPYLLLLSATPHQGKTDAFRRLMAFIDPDAFVENGIVSRERVAPFVIRTEKKHATDIDGRPLFMPRTVELQRVVWAPEHAAQRELYDAVTHYARDGYAKAQRARQTAVGFLMVLFQRMVTSSSRAITVALERRLAALIVAEGEASATPSLFDNVASDDAEFWDMDSDAQLEAVVQARADGALEERLEVETLLAAARRCQAAGPDAKAQALLDAIVALEREYDDSALKVLVFTEFLPTQAMLVEFLEAHGISAVVLNGGMGPAERQRAITEFAGDARVLVSTDAGGEGLNLQFCSTIVNYDLPWNPMKIEQRIGRVDRIGQKRPVHARNFALAESVELRVQEVLQEKLQRILDDLGIDKLADVLDSEAAGAEFEMLYADAAADPRHIEERVAQFAADIRDRAAAVRSGLLVLGDSEPPDTQAARELAEHRLPRWTERLVVASLQSAAARGGRVEQATSRAGIWRLKWPNGTETPQATFDASLAIDPAVEHLTLDDDRVRRLVGRLPTWAPGQPLPSLVVPGVSEHVSGTWGLWRVAVEGAGVRAQQVLPVFVTDDGRSLTPTAYGVWDRFLEAAPESLQLMPGAVSGLAAEQAYQDLRQVAEKAGALVYEGLLREQRVVADRETRKMTEAFSARRHALDRVGLREVREYRIRQLEEERLAWHALVRDREARLAPELRALVMVRVRAYDDARLGPTNPTDVRA